MASPGAGHLERFEGRHSLGQPRPDGLVEIGIIDLPVEPRRLVIAGVPADIAGALRAKADIAADMPGQRHRLELLANFEIKRHRRIGATGTFMPSLSHKSGPQQLAALTMLSVAIRSPDSSRTPATRLPATSRSTTRSFR